MIAANQARSVLSSFKATVKTNISTTLNEATFMNAIALAASQELKSQIDTMYQNGEVNSQVHDIMSAKVADLEKKISKGDHILHGAFDETRKELQSLLNSIVDNIFNAVEAAFSAYDAGCMLGHKSVTGAPGSITPIIVT